MLAGELRDPVRRERPRRRLLRRRVSRRLAVDGGRGGEDDTGAGRRGRLEDPLAREHVPLDVEREDVPEAAHSRLPGEMEDTVPAREVELVVREVEPPHVEAARVPLLQRGVVVVGERVDPDHLVPRGQQRLGEMRADEARSACDDVSHRSTIPYTRACPTR